MATLANVPNAANAPTGELLAAMNPRASGSASATDSAAAQDRFMTLLVTQMKNQDPLNPLDNAQVTSQLAQLSTVTGIDKLNGTMQAMMASTQASQSLQAASMIGHGVLVPGTNLSLAGGKAVFGAELPSPADAVQVTISDGAGNPVRVLELGARPAGTLALAWDGKTQSGGSAPDGSYQVQVSATRGGQKLSAAALGFGEVISVSTGGSGSSAVRLNLSGGAGAVSINDVRQIL